VSRSSGAQQPIDSYLVRLTIGALGVVYGDIGTSPLYAMRECFHGAHAVAATPVNVMGVMSLILYSLLIIISIKYITFVMRADNHGEGGILALMALVPNTSRPGGKTGVLVGLGLFGAALLYGDGMITPAISVLGAVEGLSVATPLFEPYIIPITIVILVSLFLIQHRGTGGVGLLFGPVMILWFVVIAILGIRWIGSEPRILGAINPLHAWTFFHQNGYRGFLVLGSVFLVVTGGEALYADMGHFGKRPIRIAWSVLVLPALVLNYFGQGALLLHDPVHSEHPFYLLAPAWGLYPLVALATAAAVIASQALISGAFSLTQQAIQLGYSPRLDIDYTSTEEKGQIFVPQVNWALMVSTIGLVVGFRSSSNLAAAYGIAVTMTMVITTVLLYFVARRVWRWNLAVAGSIAAFFIAIDLAFFGANALKVVQGGWFPLVVGVFIFTLMTTWKRGRAIVAARLMARAYPFDRFMEHITKDPPHRVTGTAVFMTGTSGATPPALLHNLAHNKVLHEQIVLCTVTTESVPFVSRERHAVLEELGDRFYRLSVVYGFAQQPNVPEAMRIAAEQGLVYDENETTYFLGRETLLVTRNPGMALWRERVFVLMTRNAVRATAFFRIPAERVVELGMQIEI
jgi:KUP system potassium uptake protein